MRNYFPFQPPILECGLLDSNYQYREYPPGEALKEYVSCYWSVEYESKSPDNSTLHRIIPDGCVDIIFNLKSDSFAKGAFVAGLMSQYEAMILSETYSLFGIRFFSDTVRHFIQYPVAEFSGNHVLLEDIWGVEALHFMEEIRSASGMDEILEKIERKLLQRLLVNENLSNRQFYTSMQYIYAGQGMVSMRALAENLNYSERSIRRMFQKEMGIGPKEISGIIRFQSLLKDLYHHPPARLTDIAAKYGYYDQPHFINQFKRYYGLPPNQVFKPTGSK